jgi:hypothetical protein
MAILATLKEINQIHVYASGSSRPNIIRSSGDKMKFLAILGVCSLIEHSNENFEIYLSDEFKWFLSDECQAIRGILPSPNESGSEEESDEADR